MANKLPSLIFDTSSVNWLVKDEARDEIVKGLRSSQFVLVTETCFSEIIADPDRERRERHLDLLAQLIMSGGCIMPFNWILDEQIKAYFHHPNRYDWMRLDVRFRELEHEIVRRQLSHEFSELTRSESRRHGQDFDGAFDQAREAFRQAFGLKERQTAPPFQEVAQALLARHGEHFRLATNYVADTIRMTPAPAAVQDFMERCPPFGAMLIAITICQYDRIMLADREPSIGVKAGRNDLLSAAYLPYCQRFVTSDKHQYRVFQFMKTWTKTMTTDVVLYNDFKRGLFGLDLCS